ncbi:hypothetical protein AVEN_112382-1 [Araneus ventricosus]|uniref:Uncharacterized protein n=1 Tax=Araneus ventricosus TaxID=182803 RepID=A0A4Y2M4A2_ARAVE|nr:hypothetical protein AVEN_112382-1 [Araneus ventricosus]
MKRKLRIALDLLHPDLVEDRKRKNEELLDQRLSKGQLRSFTPNDAVYIKNHFSGPTWIPGTVIEKTSPLSYKTVTPDGKSIRCHIDHMRNRKTPSVTSQSCSKTQENSTIPAASSAIPSSSNTPIKLSDPAVEIETPKGDSTLACTSSPRERQPYSIYLLIRFSTGSFLVTFFKISVFSSEAVKTVWTAAAPASKKLVFMAF